jgi:hypothetical protein
MKRIMTAAACVLMGMLGAYLMNNNVPERAWAGITCTLLKSYAALALALISLSWEDVTAAAAEAEIVSAIAC